MVYAVKKKTFAAGKNVCKHLDVCAVFKDRAELNAGFKAFLVKKYISGKNSSKETKSTVFKQEF